MSERLTLEQLREWLNRKPEPKVVESRIEEPPCEKCEGRMFVVAECSTFGWRMVPCPLCGER